MKPEFSQVLIPTGKLHTDSNNSINTNMSTSSAVNSTIIKWLLVTALLFTLIVTIVTTGFILRYEDKMVQYEERIFALETELDLFFKKLNAEESILLPGDEDLEDFEYETHPHHTAMIFDGSDEELIEIPREYGKNDEKQTAENEPFGEIKLEVQEVRSRSKRQIPFPNVPTYGPEVERTGDGVPIVEKSYLSSAGVTLTPRFAAVPTTESEGLRLYEGLVETGGRNEPKSLDFAQREGLRPILPHHTVSAAWSEKQDEGRRPRLELKSGDSSSFGVYSTSGPQFASELTYTRSSSSSRRSSSLTGTGTGSSSGYQSSNSGNTLIAAGGGSSGGTFHRNSRVPATGDYLYPKTTSTQTRSLQYPPLRKLSVGEGEGEVIARVLQSDNEAESDGPNSATASATHGQTATAEASSTRTRTGYRRRQHQQQQQQESEGPSATSYTRSYSSRRDGSKYHRKQTGASGEDSGEISIVKAEAWVEGPKPVAAHYVADVSNYTTAHRHYDGNGRLRNADGIFAAWRQADWMQADASGDGSKTFILSPTGVLTVKQPGLYYIYAQIHYLDEHDINGFSVQINTEPFLQCTTMTETYQTGSKSNSCFTAGVNYLKENDRIIIKDIETNRYSIFKPEKSFFGLMKLGESRR